MTFMRSLITFYPFFLRFISTGGESSGGRQTRTGVAVCSQRRALLVAGIVLGSLLLTAIIIAYAGPQNGRFAPCPMTHTPSVPCPKGGAILTPLRSFLFTSFSRDFFVRFLRFRPQKQNIEWLGVTLCVCCSCCCYLIIPLLGATGYVVNWMGRKKGSRNMTALNMGFCKRGFQFDVNGTIE